jgi:hypothetical protein
VTISPYQKVSIEDFFRATEPLQNANTNPISFCYLAVKQNDSFFLIQGALVFNNAPQKTPFSHFKSDDIRAGNFELSELNLDARGVVNALLSGKLSTPLGDLVFPENDVGNFGATYEPFHSEGLKVQSRFDILTILGGSQAPYVRQPFLDWQLRASPTPYDGIQELNSKYLIGPLRGVVNVEVRSFNVAAIDGKSVVSGTTAKLGVFLTNGLAIDDVTLGYRISAQGRVETRAAIKGRDMQWTRADIHQSGTVDIDVPRAAVIQCFVSYCGIAQNFWWVSDPKAMQNPKRAVYDMFDPGLEALKEFLSKSGGRGRNARDLESGVAWLLWLSRKSLSCALTRPLAILVQLRPLAFDHEC